MGLSWWIRGSSSRCERCEEKDANQSFSGMHRAGQACQPRVECIVLVKLANHVWNLSLGMNAKKLGRYCDVSLVAKCGPSGLYLVVSSVGLRCRYLAALLTVHQPRGLAYCIGHTDFVSRSRCKVACRLRYINIGTALRLKSKFFYQPRKDAPTTNGKSNTPNNEEQGPY
jgi:hypothetical protein